MKHLPTSLCLALLIFISGCHGTTQQSQFDDSTVRVSNLTNYLNSQPRIKIIGQGHNATIHSSPLIILDDIQIGHDFRQAYSLLDQNEYVSIKILTMRKATVFYGEEGSNGAIIITRVEK